MYFCNIIIKYIRLMTPMKKVFLCSVLAVTGINKFAANAQEINKEVNTDTAGAVVDSIKTLNIADLVVMGRRPDAIVTADKVSYSPSATLSGSGGSIFDTMSSLPGVTVDTNGTITVNGQKGVTVTINGRKSILSGNALVNYLKSLPADNVDRIEILSAPSAKLDASGAMSVVNIKMKRMRDEGFTLGLNGDGQFWKIKRGYGNMYAGYGRGHNKMSLSYSAMSASTSSELFTDRPYLVGDSRLLQSYYRRRNDLMHYIATSYDCRIINALTTGVSLSANWYTRKENADMYTDIPSYSQNVVTDNRNNSYIRNVYGNYFMKYTFAQPESDVVFNFDFFNYHTAEKQFMADNMDTDIDGTMRGTTKGYVWMADFKRMLSEKWLFAAGVKVACVKIGNGGRYNNSNSDEGQYDNLSSEFGYRENVNAIYAEGRAKYGNITATMGLRLENENVKTAFSGNEAVGKTDYEKHATELFPNISLQINAGASDAFALSAIRRISRPQYSDLNPFIYIFDDITHVGGNIGLRSAISNNLQLSWSHGAWLRVMLMGGCTDNAIVRYFRDISDKVVYVSPENLPRHLMASFTVTAVNIPLFSWWRTSLTGTLFYNNYRFPDATGLSPNCLFTPMLDCKNHFKFSDGWAAEVSASLRGNVANGQAVAGTVSNVYVGVKKSVFHNKANITLYVRDLLNTNRKHSEIMLNGKRATLDEREFEDMRLMGISFSLHINAGRAKLPIGHKEIITDEMKRANR